VNRFADLRIQPLKALNRIPNKTPQGIQKTRKITVAGPCVSAITAAFGRTF